MELQWNTEQLTFSSGEGCYVSRLCPDIIGDGSFEPRNDKMCSW